MFNNTYRTGLTGVIVLIVIAAIMPGCRKNFLDRTPLGQYTPQNYPYPTGGGPYDQYIFAAYSNLRNDVHADGSSNNAVSGFNFMGAVSIRSDDADKGSTPGDSPDQIAMDNFPVTPTNGLINDLWNGYYACITKCNIVLFQVGKDSSTTPQAVKALAQAEAKFIRGYNYFMLVRLFGRVPLVDTLLTNVANQSNIPQSDPAAIYSLIIKDLQYAAANLPLKWDEKFIGRATSGAANGLLAKVYLYQKNWAMAMATAGLVINSGIYDLNTPYNKIFTEAGENSSESLFEIQAYADASHKEDPAYGSQYAMVQGVRGAGVFNLGWGFNIPSDFLLAAYEPGDPREASTVLPCPSIVPTMYGEVFPVEPNPRYNMKVYTNPAVRSTVGDQFGWWMNVRILRYADVLLMYAEAANELGNTSEALAKLELVRARARNGDNTILPPITTTDQTQLRAAIQHERRIELAMEHERFFDIVRWGIAAQALHSANRPNYTEPRDKLLPIPQAQLDLSKGVLTQNPGY